MTIRKKEEKLLSKIARLENELFEERQIKKRYKKEITQLNKRLITSEIKTEKLEIKLRDELKKKVDNVFCQIASLGIDMKNL